MNVVQIVDFVIGCFFILSVFVGYRRGFVVTIAGIVAMVTSYIVAGGIAAGGKSLLAQYVLLPFLNQKTGSGLFADLAKETVLQMSQGIAYAILFFVSFGVLEFVLFRFVSALKLVKKIPVIGWLDKVGGAVLGFLWVFLLCTFLGSVFFQYVPGSIRHQWGFTQKAVEHTIFLNVFAE
jgi:hypothetical protein